MDGARGRGHSEGLDGLTDKAEKGRARVSILSVGCALALAIAAVFQATMLVRDFGTVRFTYFGLTSAIAAATAASAVIFRSEWPTRLSGAGLGAWAAIAFAPFFLFGTGASTIVGWLILAGIAAMIASLRFEGRLLARGVVRQLAAGAAVVFVAVLAIEIGLVAVTILLANTSI